MRIERDRSPSSIVCVCPCGARDVAASRAAADSWLGDHLDRCQVLKARAREEEARKLRARDTRNPRKMR